MKTVFVGMSGGVDSSVTAALLKEQGYAVVGVFMKNWTKDLPGFPCPWKQDFQDAKRVAVQLGIDFKVYDFEKQYRQKVVDYMLREYKAGRTPNPDIMCNQEMKFKLFLETALSEGADLIATGHYASLAYAEKTVRGPSSHKTANLTGLPQSPSSSVRERTSHIQVQSPKRISSTRSQTELHVARNADKDQTYFLYRVTEEALSKTLFPLGDFKSKAEVRSLAKKFGLVTADKKDSQGICFVGKVGIKDFLLHELGPQPSGEIIDQNGKIIGKHEGAIFYTIGQRHGLNVGGGLPYYVVGKDMQKNHVIVSTNLDDENLWRHKLEISNVHWINESPEANKTYEVRTRYRAKLIRAHLEKTRNRWQVKLQDPVRAVTAGQSAVVYDGARVVGGGICEMYPSQNQTS